MGACDFFLLVFLSFIWVENTLGWWWGRGSWVSIWYGDLILLRLLIPDRFVSFIFCCKLVAYISHILRLARLCSSGYFFLFHFSVFFLGSFFGSFIFTTSSSVAGNLQRELIAVSGSGFISYTLSSFFFLFFFFLHFFFYLLSYVLTFCFYFPWFFYISLGIVIEDLWNLRNGDASH